MSLALEEKLLLDGFNNFAISKEEYIQNYEDFLYLKSSNKSFCICVFVNNTIVDLQKNVVVENNEYNQIQGSFAYFRFMLCFEKNLEKRFVKNFFITFGKASFDDKIVSDSELQVNDINYVDLGFTYNSKNYSKYIQPNYFFGCIIAQNSTSYQLSVSSGIEFLKTFKISFFNVIVGIRLWHIFCNINDNGIDLHVPIFFSKVNDYDLLPLLKQLWNNTDYSYFLGLSFNY